MSDAALRQSGLPHAVFLRRLAGAPSATEQDARLSQGAFLALRLVDLLADPHPLYTDAFHYQHAATERVCRDLPVDNVDTAHLVGLVRAAADAFQACDVRLVLPALLAYAHHLEDALQLEEALDVLRTVLSLGSERLGSSDRIATHLRIGRVNRKLNRFDDADAAYGVAAELADLAGDVHSALLSRVGLAITTQARGNLVESERLFWALSVDARAAGERDVEARAHHALGTTLLLRGQADEGIVHVCRALEFYEEDSSRLRALTDMGVMLLALGHVEEAERALGEVVRRGEEGDGVNNALIELMHCASYRGDRVGFERRRTQCELRVGDMPPNILADFYFKAGIGNARFRNVRKGRGLMEEALKIAARSGLHELEFRVERVMAGLRDCETECVTKRQAAAEPALSTEALQEVSASLARLES